MVDQCECFYVSKGRNDNMQFSKRGNNLFLRFRGYRWTSTSKFICRRTTLTKRSLVFENTKTIVWSNEMYRFDQCKQTMVFCCQHQLGYICIGWIWWDIGELGSPKVTQILNPDHPICLARILKEHSTSGQIGLHSDLMVRIQTQSLSYLRGSGPDIGMV